MTSNDIKRAQTAQGAAREPARISLVRATAAAGALGAVAAVLVRALAGQVDTWGGAAPSADGVVAAACTAIGVLAAATLAVGSALLAASALVAALGGASHRLDAAARRLTPALLRRAVAVAVGTGLGLAASTGAAGAAEVDLGWAVTSADRTAVPAASGSAVAGPRPGTSAGATTSPGSDDLAVGWVVTGDGAARDAGGERPAEPVTVATAGAETGSPGAAAPAVAGTPGPAAVAPQGHAASPAIAPAVPTATAVQTATAAPTASAAPSRSAGTVTVQPGDTLWAIAARHLPAGSSAADVAAAWPAWFAANAAVVGDDPDLIQPGQRLAVPDAVATATGATDTEEQS